MHRFLRTIGFSKIKNHRELNVILKEVMEKPTKKWVIQEDDEVYVKYEKEFGENIGIAVIGILDENDSFQMEYYYPYIIGQEVSIKEEVDVKRHSDRESYAGICDEVKVGVAMIFYLQNIMEHKIRMQKKLPSQQVTSVVLTALSEKGMILFPVNKSPIQKKNSDQMVKERNHLIAAAREGDEDAIENLTLEDMDTYTVLSKRVEHEDILTIVDTYFMPYGIESDQYSIMGEITDVDVITNERTQEAIYNLTLNVNDLIFKMIINKEDLLGEPEIGRRFKGNVWMQGKLLYE